MEAFRYTGESWIHVLINITLQIALAAPSRAAFLCLLFRVYTSAKPHDEKFYT